MYSTCSTRKDVCATLRVFLAESISLCHSDVTFLLLLTVCK
jgi:hypothetical protein